LPCNISPKFIKIFNKTGYFQNLLYSAVASERSGSVITAIARVKQLFL
jgi:hypothetical protein